MSFVQELKRRNVVRIAVMYIIAAWLLLQVTEVGMGLLELPGWVGRFVLLVVALGFLPAVILSWIYELTPDGIKRTSEVPAGQGIAHETGRRINVLIGILAPLAVLAIAADRLFPEAGSTSPAVAPVSQITEDASIAVLPFVDMSRDQDQAYFSEGLSEELLNLLAKTPALRVISRTSSFQFKDHGADIRAIADQLGVANILEGSVRKSGNKVRITAQLIQASDGSHLWSETYDRDLDDIFAVQDEIAGAVVQQLKVTLLDQQLPITGRTDNMEAHTLYLQGRYFADRRSRENFERAVDYYRQALEVDADYSLAWAALSEAYVNQVAYGHLPFDTGVPLAREAGTRALQLDPDLAEAHLALGELQYTLDWDWGAADWSFRRALELDPGNAVALRLAGNLASVFGRTEESIHLLRQSLERDPLRSATYNGLGMTLLQAGRSSDAMAMFRKVLELQPDFAGAHNQVARVLLLEDQPLAALEEIEKEHDGMWRAASLPLIYHALGRNEESDAALETLIRVQDAVAAFQIAEVHAFRGNIDAAFEWLERAYEQRDGGLTELIGDPLLDNIRDDPRYPAFLDKMKLPHEVPSDWPVAGQSD